ncbi:MAG: Ku protein, partial [Candidatus Hydrogenedentes bacterium]|nr:Ku protein [Candidatus Hydrogenedentota bacterium]
YYVIPGAKGDKGYVLLRETLKRTGQAGIAKVVIHTREYLSALFAQGRGLVLGLLRFDNELRKLDEFDLPSDDLEGYKVNDRELKMAEQLVEAMHTDWAPEKYKDDYRDALLEWIEKKAKEGEAAAIAEAPEEKAPKPTEIIDFMEQMKKSLERKKKAAEEAGKPAPPKKRAGGGRRK